MPKNRRLVTFGALMAAAGLLLSGCSIGELNSAADQINKAADDLESALPTPVGQGPESGSAKLVYARNAQGTSHSTTHYWTSAACTTQDDELFQWTVPGPDSDEAQAGETFTGLRNDDGTWTITADLVNYDGESYFVSVGASEAEEVGPIVATTSDGMTIDFHALRMQGVDQKNEVFVNGEIDCG